MISDSRALARAAAATVAIAAAPSVRDAGKRLLPILDQISAGDPYLAEPAALVVDVLAGQRRTSPWLHGVVLAALDSRRAAGARLRSRSATPRPQLPARHAGHALSGPDWPTASPSGLGRPASVPSAALPGALDARTADDLLRGTPTAARRLSESERAALAVSLVLIGTSIEWDEAISVLGEHVKAATPLAAWRRWKAEGSADLLLDRLCGLADHLARRPPPIDYERRCDTWPSTPGIGPWAFNRLCREHGLIRTERLRRRCGALVWELLTGTPAGLCPAVSGLQDAQDATGYRLWWKDLPAVALALHAEVAEKHLLDHRIDEPVSSRPALTADGTWTDVQDFPHVLPGWTSPSRLHSLRQASRTRNGATAEDLQHFAVLAQHGSATAAAAATGIPAALLSATLCRLEALEGVDLVVRAERGRSQTLTPAGRSLRVHVARVAAAPPSVAGSP